MDVVYVVRDGFNHELLYSLRSLQNVNHDNVWVIGGSPYWLNPDTVGCIPRAQSGSSYRSTREHVRAACNTKAISDPFMLWNDDYFAMRPVGDLPMYHRGSLLDVLAEFEDVRTPWAKGLRATADVLAQKGVKLSQEDLSYDVHLPLIVHKREMMTSLRWAEGIGIDALHTRTIYGNMVGGGEFHHDPQMTRRGDLFPTGNWLSSNSNTFRNTIEPVLRYVFPDPSNYEEN